MSDLEGALAVDGDRWLPELHHGSAARACRAASEAGDFDAERRRHVLRQSELLGRSGETAAARALLTDLMDGTSGDP